MKVLVTGKSGQLALALAERNRSRFDLDLVGRPDLDLEVAGSAAMAIVEARPDVVINAAAYTAVDQAEDEQSRAMRVNADAAEEIAAAAHQVGASIVQISTDYVFNGNSEGFYRESAGTSPVGVYGHSKLAGEARVKIANSRHVIVRTSWVYSPFGHNFVKSIMAAAKVRDVLSVVDDQRGTPTSAFDLADGILSMVERWQSERGLGLGETFHLSGTGCATWYNFASSIMAECRRLGLATADIRPIASSEWSTKARRPLNSRLCSDKFAATFGFVMPPWEESLSRVVERLAE